jgi:uncharacterized protein YoxC
MPALLPLPVLSVMLLEAAWVGPAMAISLVVIALSFLAIALGALLAGREAARTLRGLREAVSGGKGLARKLEQEVDALIQTSQRLRHDLNRGVKRAKRRLSDFDALAEVMQEELEDTALDVASKLRGLRSGLGVIGRLRRLLPRRRR